MSGCWLRSQLLVSLKLSLRLSASSLLSGSADCLGTVWLVPKPVLEHPCDPQPFPCCIDEHRGSTGSWERTDGAPCSEL